MSLIKSHHLNFLPKVEIAYLLVLSLMKEILLMYVLELYYYVNEDF